MLTKECKEDRLRFMKSVQKIMQSMGLSVLEKGVDYNHQKPDLVAVYPDMKKYYVVEVFSDACIESPSPRLYLKDINEEYRDYCRKLFADNENHGAIAAGVICDLANGLELFSYKALGKYEFNSMARYGVIAAPIERTGEIATVLERLGIDFRTLDVLDDFTLVLISKDNTIQLAESKKFIKFILENR